MPIVKMRIRFESFNITKQDFWKNCLIRNPLVWKGVYLKRGLLKVHLQNLKNISLTKIFKVHIITLNERYKVCFENLQ